MELDKIAIVLSALTGFITAIIGNKISVGKNKVDILESTRLTLESIIQARTEELSKLSVRLEILTEKHNELTEHYVNKNNECDKNIELLSNKIKALEDFSKTFILTCDSDGITVAINGDPAPISGYKIEELIGKPIDIIIPPSDRIQHHDAFVRRIENSDKPYTTTLRNAFLLTKSAIKTPVQIVLTTFKQTGKFIAIAEFSRR